MEKIIIIGAPRSGTNMLRDILVQFKTIETWPCDEINYIWRHGNIHYNSDEFTSDMATPSTIHYVRCQFQKISKKTDANIIVEKTCANSMRVSFVDKVTPDAKYIFIVRDGLDVVGSAMLRWTAKLDIPYIMKKAYYVPLTDLPYYASRYFLNRIYRLFSKDKRLAFWGPQMNDMDQLLDQYSLIQVCALQWKRSVENAEHDFQKILNDRVLRIKYEDFVTKPTEETRKILHFIGMNNVNIEKISKFTQKVSSKNIGKGRSLLTKKEREEIIPLIQDTLVRHDYEA